jgi:hypothetical protein
MYTPAPLSFEQGEDMVILYILLPVALIALAVAAYMWWRATHPAAGAQPAVSATVAGASAVVLGILSVVLIVLVAANAGGNTSTTNTSPPGSGAPPGAPGSGTGPGSGPNSGGLAFLQFTTASAGVYPTSPSDCKGPGDVKFNMTVGGAPDLVAQANGAQATMQMTTPTGATQTQVQTINNGKVNFDFHYDALPANGTYTGTVIAVNGQQVPHPNTQPGPAINCG